MTSLRRDKVDVDEEGTKFSYQVLNFKCEFCRGETARQVMVDNTSTVSFTGWNVTLVCTNCESFNRISLDVKVASE